MTREIRAWRARAEMIPDPVLRQLALATHRTERGNLEGAAAFAVLAPRRRRDAVVRAAVAFQALYDYIDTLAEQPSSDPLANGHQLHLALLAALDPRIDRADYYCYGPNACDGDYMMSMIAACRRACEELPSYSAARPPALRAARRMVSYQAFTHCLQRPGQGDALAHWADSITPAQLDLEWWETAAGAASSLGVFALIAASAHGDLAPETIAAIEGAYFPWVGALHVLLDSFADRGGDLLSGHHSLVAHYSGVEREADRLGTIAARALEAIARVPQGPAHATILAAMISFYLGSPGAQTTALSLTREEILQRLGALRAPTMAIVNARRAAHRAISRRG